MTSRILCSLFCLLLTQTACAQPRAVPGLNGVAVKVIDGDTFDLLAADHTTYRIRLYGIDCPERGMDYYKVCKTALGRFCEGKQLKVLIRDKDRYQRTVGDLYTSDGKWINLQMVAGGYAWHYARYSNDERLKLAAQKARKQKLGLWAMPEPTAPWEWRKERRQKRSY